MTLVEFVVGGGVLWSVGTVWVLASAWPARQRQRTLSLHDVPPSTSVEPIRARPAASPVPLRRPVDLRPGAAVAR